MGNKVRQNAAYVAVLAACFAIGMAAAWWPELERIDNQAYDWMLARTAQEPWTPQSVVVAIDEAALRDGGGMPGIRRIEAAAVRKIAAAQPRAVALDITLPDRTRDEDDAELESALRGVANILVLPCNLGGGTWEYPLARFRVLGSELGHVYWKPSTDGVTRVLPLDEIAHGAQHWALALQAFSVAQKSAVVQAPPDGIEVGDLKIPARRDDPTPQMWIRYLRSGVPIIPSLEVDQHRDELRGKTVFLGITALDAARDRVVTPFGREITGVEVHANAYETLARGKFLVPARNDVEFLLCAALALSAGLIFALLSGWQAYALGAVLLLIAHSAPLWFFRYDIVFPYVAPVSVAWLSALGAATFQYFFVRRELRKSESERSRYQQALQWTAHEMRTPLTAIQGSSEIMTRYALPDAKRNELSEMINSESKRLARMIQTFLDVERLADGHMELKREPFDAAGVVATCVKRATQIAERKKISISVDGDVEGTVTGDRELMEYAFYNLLTNAVKYSPAETEIHVISELRGGELRLSVRDQGIGMDAKELKSIFKKFYRTKSAEASGEAGTGIGLSIVEQIVTHHRGRLEVKSELGKGSCFTIIVAAIESGKSPGAGQYAKTSDRRG